MAGSKIVFSKGTQLTVYIDNRKGTLSALATFLGKHGINIYGLTLADTEGHGYARLIVDDTEKARQLVEDSGELVGAREVLLVRVENEPGQLGRVLAALAEREGLIAPEADLLEPVTYSQQKTRLIDKSFDLLLKAAGK